MAIKSSLEQKIKINDLIKQHCHVDGEFCIYHDGWTDNKIADALGAPGITNVHVAHVRKELFGNLRTHGGGSNSELAAQLDSMQTMFTAMQGDYTRLLDRLIKLEDRHDRLCQTLSMNQVAQVSHLRTTSK